LTGDEQIIVNGVVNARPGSKVSPQPGDMSRFSTDQLQLSTATNREEVVKRNGPENPQQEKKTEGTGQNKNPAKPGGGR